MPLPKVLSSIRTLATDNIIAYSLLWLGLVRIHIFLTHLNITMRFVIIICKCFASNRPPSDFKLYNRTGWLNGYRKISYSNFPQSSQCYFTALLLTLEVCNKRPLGVVLSGPLLPLLLALCNAVLFSAFSSNTLIPFFVFPLQTLVQSQCIHQFI